MVAKKNAGKRKRGRKPSQSIVNEAENNIEKEKPEQKATQQLTVNEAENNIEKKRPRQKAIQQLTVTTPENQESKRKRGRKASHSIVNESENNIEKEKPEQKATQQVTVNEAENNIEKEKPEQKATQQLTVNEAENNIEKKKPGPKAIQQLTVNEAENNNKKRKRGRKALTDETRWTDKEMIDLAAALQLYGAKDTGNIALAVKTKSENAVKALITREITKARSKLFKGSKLRRQDIHSVNLPLGTTEGWPSSRKWQKIAQNQMMHCLRGTEYSPRTMIQIWEHFLDQQPPPKDRECMDLRAIYAYIVQCIRGGNLPPLLPPKESALILRLFRTFREMLNEMGWEDEKDFIVNFKKATKFVPFNVKDEFKKGGNKDETVLEEGCVRIPEELYLGLNRHKKLQQSFNPLQVPQSLLQKERNFLTRMFADE